MKKIFFYLILCVVTVLSACEKHDYAKGVLSPISGLEEVRNLYKGTDVTLNRENLNGAHQIVGVVISDPSGRNNPEGLIVLQNNRNKKIRGISIPLGSANTYSAGDSLKVVVEGATLKRVNGSLQLVGVNSDLIEKISSNNPVTVQTISTLELNTKSELYESTLVSIKSGSFVPEVVDGETLAGDKTMINGVNTVILHTESNAAFATDLLPLSVNVTGIIHLADGLADLPVLQIWPRVAKDIVNISDPVIDPIAAKYKIIISGFVSDSRGGDGNYEYIQLIATDDIDFSETPFSVVTCTNAGSTPIAAGWATGGARTYKFNLREGTVKKGEFFYVGGSNKKINGPNSTDISSAKWIRSIAYVTNAGDGIGDKTGGLFPNSGNAGGIALFAGTNIKEDTVPMDVVFFGGVGTKKDSMFNLADAKGYRVADNDHYSTTDPVTGDAQPFFYQGTNDYSFAFILDNPDSEKARRDAGNFVKLGGIFNVSTKQWIKPRGFEYYPLTMETPIIEIEDGLNVIILVN